MKPAEKDQRLRVRHTKTGEKGLLTKMVTRTYCTVQFTGSKYYTMCKIEELEPIDG